MKTLHWLLGAVWLTAVGSSHASDTAPASAPSVWTNQTVTLAQVNARLLTLSNRTDDLSALVRSNALALYAETRQRLLDTEQAQEETRRLSQEIVEAPLALAELQRQLEVSEVSPPPAGSALPAQAPLADFEQQLARLEADLAQALKEQESLAQEPQRRSARVAELTRLSTEARTARDRLQQELRSPPSPDLEPELRQAVRDRLQARWQWRETELARYEQELAALHATGDLARLRLDLARRQVSALTHEREQAAAALNRRRDQETHQATARAEQALRRADLLHEPLLTRLAATNTVLARERTSLAGRLRTTGLFLDAVQTNLAAQRTAFQSLQAHVEAAEQAGLHRNYAIGLLLRRQQTALERQGDPGRQAEQQRLLLSAAQITQFTITDAWRNLDPLDVSQATLVASLPATNDPPRQALLAEEVRTLLGEQRELLGGLIRDYDTYLGLLLRIQGALRESLAQRETFAAFLDQRVLWIRSAETLSPAVIRQEAEALQALLASAEWGQSLSLLGQALRQALVSHLALGFGIALLLALRPRLRRRLTEDSNRARQGRNTSIAPTVAAGWYTLLLALPVPLLIALLGWRTVAGATFHQSTILLQLGLALKTLAGTLFVWGFLRQICRPEDGLAVAHFRLPEEDASLLRQSLTRCLWLVPLLSFVNRFFEADAIEGVSNRLTFIPTTLAVAVFAHWVLRRRGGLGASTMGETGEQGGRQLGRRTVHLLAVGVPILFAAASVLGYHYSARHLWVRFLLSVLVALGLKLVGAFFFRWFYLQRRRLAMAHAEKLRSAEAAEGPTASPLLPLPEVETQADLLTYLAQARRVLRWAFGLTLLVCLWGIWSSVLPALQALDRLPLWSLDPGMAGPASLPAAGYPAPLPGGPAAAATAGARLAPTEPTEQAPFVSLWDLLLMLLVGAVVVMAARNLPGFLEMTVFSNLQLERGAGYALTATLRYAIILVGVIVVAQGLGLSWNKVHWLAAAITVGIGFGLQEVFANFVSGLILLFERPVRVGDIVTVADVSGVVTRIQIRATTIRDWDNRELILPNKELITGRFVNWTLSDSVTRILCPVGVAYDTDIRKARELMLDLAHRHPAVLAEPAPSVAFEGFGESTLNLTLRAHVSRTDQRLSTLSDLNAAILEGFRQAGIEIAYPQRDLHVRSLPPGWLPSSPAGSPPPAPPAPPASGPEDLPAKNR